MMKSKSFQKNNGRRARYRCALVFGQWVATAVSGRNLSADGSQGIHRTIPQWQDEFVILDIRTPGEYAQGHISGVVLMDFYSPRV